MSQLKTNSIVDASGGNTATINGVAPNVNNIRGKNKIINGNFDVWQRGTSFTTFGYTADRYFVNNNTSSFTMSQQAFTLGQTDVPNEPKYFSRCSVTTASLAGSFVLQYQAVESVRTLAGQTATLSFWAKADASKNIAIEFNQYFGTGGSPSTSVTGIGVTTFSLTTSWQKFEVTVSIPSISGKTLGTNNDDSLLAIFWLEAGSDFNARTNSLGNQSGTFDIAQVQLEAGDTASGFEHLSYGETLALCQRYYWRHEGTVYLNMAAKTAASTTAHTQVFPPVPFRSNTYSIGFGSFSNVSGVAATQLDYTGFRINGTATSGSGTAAVITIAVDAEL